jgi:hypothetical protein
MAGVLKIVWRIFFVAVCFTVGGFAAVYAQPYVHDNADALLVITTVFAVFAGFMVAIISILGDLSHPLIFHTTEKV